MDVALTLEFVCGRGVRYRGSVTDNTKEAYEALVWEDPDVPKPSWNALQVASIALQAKLSLERVRALREPLLKAADHKINALLDFRMSSGLSSVVSDKLLDAEAAWGAYRQALRDIPQTIQNDPAWTNAARSRRTEEYVDSLVWPTAPEIFG